MNLWLCFLGLLSCAALSLAWRKPVLLRRQNAAPLAKPQPGHPVQDYYTDAGPDYGLWSAHFYMHFGYLRRPIECLSLETMLANLGEETLKSLDLPPDKPIKIIDLGCGMAAVARQAALAYPQAQITGLTLVPAQVREGGRLNRAAGLDERIQLRFDDFEHSNLDSGQFDAAYAIEAACYGQGAAKAAFLAETKRLLKPGGRIAITDGFRLHGAALPRWLRTPYRWLCACWALPELAQIQAMTAELERLGFTNIQVRDLRWHVAPSVVYVPWTTLKFLAHALRLGELFRLKTWRWKNLVSPWLTMILGLQIRHFGYFMITATKGV